MFKKPITDHILSQIYDMQQRGDRLLSIVDLINAGTVSLELATHLISLIIRGISISSGSFIGGTGKTTLLASLLAFLPEGRNIITVTSSNLKALNDQIGKFKNTIFLCHEISPANYYSYLWGKDLKLYFNLKNNNNHLAFTIHADSPDEVYQQIVNKDSGLSRESFFKIDTLVFIKTIGNGFHARRRITSLYEKDEISCKHVLTYTFDSDRFSKLNDSPLLSKELISIKPKIQNFLKSLIEAKIYSIETVRKKFLSLLPQII